MTAERHDPGDEAAGRVPDPVVRNELAFQDAQRAKRHAAEALREGDLARATDLLGDAELRLYDILGAAPAFAAPRAR